MTIDLLIFDLDGVLVESEVLVARTLSERLSGIGIAVDADTIIRRFHYVPYPTITERLAVEQGVTVPDGFLDTLPDVYAAALTRDLVATPGAREALSALPLRKCIASGSRPEGLRRKLELVGFLDFFEPHLFSAFDAGQPKPAPDVFHMAARALGVEPARCLVVEDAVVGIEAARAAGMHALGYCGGGHCHDGWADALQAAGAHDVLHDLRLLPAYLQGLGAHMAASEP